MRFLAWIFLQVLVGIYSIGACRILSMTFKTFSRSITIKNHKWAAIFIAYKNTWGISTSAEKRNRMSYLGVFSYIMFFPQIVFFVHNCRVYLTAGIAGITEIFSLQETYIIIAGFFYMIAINLKINEANRFNKGEIW